MLGFLHLALALAAFVGTHLALSHPLRAPLVARFGENGFRILYSVVALVTFAWAIIAYGRAPFELMWQPVISDTGLLIANFVMLIASILLVGAFTAPNPFVKALTTGLDAAPQVKGVYVVTRHPLMWSFALWAIVHAVVNGDVATFMLSFAIAFLALFGAAQQDKKLAKKLGAPWRTFEAETSYVPFGAVAAGRQSLFGLGVWALVAGLILYAVLAVAHPFVFGVPVLR